MAARATSCRKVRLNKDNAVKIGSRYYRLPAGKSATVHKGRKLHVCANWKSRKPNPKLIGEGKPIRLRVAPKRRR